MKNPEHESLSHLYEARHEPENLRPIAELYWRILLVFALIVVCCAIGFGVWEFSAVMSTISSATTNANAPQQAPIDRDVLENTINQFSERRAEFEYSKGVPPSIPDPSK